MKNRARIGELTVCLLQVKTKNNTASVLKIIEYLSNSNKFYLTCCGIEWLIDSLTVKGFFQKFQGDRRYRPHPL